jgi:hypothetical protein
MAERLSGSYPRKWRFEAGFVEISEYFAYPEPRFGIRTVSPLLASSIFRLGRRDHFALFEMRILNNLLCRRSIVGFLMTILGHLRSSPVTTGNVCSSQDRSFRVRKADIAIPLTGMCAIHAVTRERPMGPFIADAVEKVGK